MNGRTQNTWCARLYLAGIVGALVIGAAAMFPAPAQAGVWVSGGAPCCGWYGPRPWWGGYYGYYPAPYYYTPPPAAYYPPPPPAGYAPPPAAPAPTAYTSPPAARTAYTPPAGTAGAAAAVTYTNKPAFRNAQGQSCREYMTHNGGQSVYGTACQAADGQWRVVN